VAEQPVGIPDLIQHLISCLCYHQLDPWVPRLNLGYPLLVALGSQDDLRHCRSLLLTPSCEIVQSSG
jgi:hypothetical protein